MSSPSSSSTVRDKESVTNNSFVIMGFVGIILLMVMIFGWATANNSTSKFIFCTGVFVCISILVLCYVGYCDSPLHDWVCFTDLRKTQKRLASKIETDNK